MNLQHLQDFAIAPALSLLPPQMDSREARVMLVAISLQECDANKRKQIRGPARGYWQFESGGGVHGVMTHHATKAHARALCDALDIRWQRPDVFEAIRYQDVLAAGFARLLLWSLPMPLPTKQADGWAQYIEAWRPGKPHPDRWPGAWRAASRAVAR